MNVNEEMDGRDKTVREGRTGGARRYERDERDELDERDPLTADNCLTLCFIIQVMECGSCASQGYT